MHRLSGALLFVLSNQKENDMSCKKCLPLIIQAVKMTDDLITGRCSACGEGWDNAGRPRWDETRSKGFAAKIQGEQISGFLDCPQKLSKLHQVLINKTEDRFHELNEASKNSFFAAREVVLD